MNSEHNSQAWFKLFLWILLCLGMIVFLSQSFQIRSDISFFLPQDSDSIAQIMQHQLKEGEAGKIYLIALADKASDTDRNSNTKRLAQINKELTVALKKHKEFVQVKNGHLALSKLIIEPFYTYRYLLDNQFNSTSQSDSFSETRLRQSFQQLIQRLQLMLTPVEQRLFAEDPQMTWFSLLKQWQTQTLQKHYGVWFDQSGQQTVLFVKTRADAYDLIQQKANLQFITHQINLLIQPLNDSSQLNIETIISGAPVFALNSKRAISQQIKTISVLASMTLMVFLFWFFRSLKIILLLGLPPAIAVLTGLTSVIFIDGFIHGITLAFGITIIGIAVDYPVHFFTHATLLRRKNIMSSLWPMLRLGLITTVIGFSAITLSNFAGLRQLGIFAISGLIAAALFTRSVLPLLSITIGKGSKQYAYNTLRSWVTIPIHSTLRILTLFLPMLAVIIIALNNNHLWQKDLSALSPTPQKLKQQDFNLRKAMGLPELRYTFIIAAETVEQVLQQSEQLKPRLNQLIQKDIISAYDMTAHYLPSALFQTQRQASLPRTAELEKTLNSLLQATDLNPQAFAPFLQAVEKSRQLTTLTFDKILDNQSDNFISDKVKTLLFQNEDKHWIALIPLQGVHKDFTKNGLDSMDFSPAQLLDLKAQTETMLSQYRNEAILWFFCGLLLILVTLFSSHKTLTGLLALAGPFTGAVLMTIATLLLIGYSLSVFHLVTLLLVVGLGIDYSIFTFKSCADADNTIQAHEISQVSVIICTISTLIMFGSLSLSDLPVLKAIGLTASLGAFYAFLFSFILSRPSQNTQ